MLSILIAGCDIDEDKNNPIGSWKSQRFLIEDAEQWITYEEFNDKYVDIFEKSLEDDFITDPSDKITLTFYSDGELEIKNKLNEDSETSEWVLISDNQIKISNKYDGWICHINNGEITIPISINFITKKENEDRIFNAKYIFNRQ
jgi:hypothetical protein